jgi:exosortase
MAWQQAFGLMTQDRKMSRIKVTWLSSTRLRIGLLLFSLLGPGLWAYWPTLQIMWRKWQQDPQYSHGYLVPLFALFLLFSRRGQLDSQEIRFSWMWLPLLCTGLLLRILAAYIYFDWLDAASMVPCLAGLVVLLGGRQALRWALPALAFLLFMIPLPYRLETALAQPLRGIATQVSTFVLQTAGCPALAEGNTILLGTGKIGVAEACSGLSMLLIFLALSTAVVAVIRRPLLDKIVILASAVPIAMMANVVRISATGVVQEWFGRELAEKVFHDWAGFLMMPLALAILGLELWILACLLRSPQRGDPIPVALSMALPVRQGTAKAGR